MSRPIEWEAVQVCGQCGSGHFRLDNTLAICDECGHEHMMDSSNLDECESFGWTDDGRLMVTSYWPA